MTTPLLDAATALRRDILAARRETETQRQLPQPILDALAEADLFRMSVPAAHGGAEGDPVEVLAVYEELARAEPAVAWCVWNSALPSLFGRYLDDDAREAVFGNPAGKYAGSTRPTGRAERHDGVWKVQGRWSLVSGCMHADWVVLATLEEEDGELRMPEPGMPVLRLAFVPVSDVRIVDTWHVGGLRGTGSHDVVAEGLDVPVERTFTPMDPRRMDHPLARLPAGCAMAMGHAAICLGIARSSLDELLTLGRAKVTVDPIPHLPDREANQELVARGGTLLLAMRERLRAVMGRLWSTAISREAPAPELLADGWSAAVTTGRICRDLVGEFHEAAGTPALYEDNVLERNLRDIHAAMQHIVAQRTWLQEAGRVAFGMEPVSPLFPL
jgi:alkylation response protein AidB-like acyl-CoA dehydrogenase